MQQPLVECVPNFSEGRDRAVLDAIADAIRSVDGVQLLDVDPGADTNRTVFTFVGPPEPVKEAAFQAIKTASERIDMRTHAGAHPRIGATDVCPLIPIQGITVEACVRLAEELGERVAQTLQIPVYLYESAARSEDRRNLASIRAGEYEGLRDRLQDPAWQPDFPAPYNARAGATVIGVRDFLIAYNVNLNTTDKRLAHDVALSIREAGRAARDEHGQILKDPLGNTIKVPGLLPFVKAVGWYIDAYRQAQVSINLTNYKQTPPHVVYDTIRAEAEKRGLVVTGSELVGLIPLDAMLSAGRHYLEKQGRSPGVPEEELVETAVRSLGLDQLAPFDPRQKIIEYRFRALAGPLASMTVREFANVLSTDAPAPGGGSTAALAGALAASLASMVANLTANSPAMGYKRKRGDTDDFTHMCHVAERAQEIKDACLRDIDADTEAFNQMLTAIRSKDPASIEAATMKAIDVPMRVLESAVDAARLALEALHDGMASSASDAATGAAMAWAAAQGAYYNVLINARDVPDREAILERARKSLDDARKKSEEALAFMERTLSRGPAPEPVASRTPTRG